MVVAGVVLLLLAGLLVADIVLENSGQTEAMLMGQYMVFDVWGLFLLGLATGIALLAGIQITLHGLARDRRRQPERRRAKEQAGRGRRGRPAAKAGPAAQAEPEPDFAIAPRIQPADEPAAPARPGSQDSQAADSGPTTRVTAPALYPGDRVVATVADLRRRQGVGPER